MLRIPVALLLLALVVPRLPAIPTGTASLHRVPRSQPKSDLEGDTDVLVQDVDQVINKVNKALGDTDDSAETDSDDTAKGLSVKTTEVRISPTQDQNIDESEEDDGAGIIPEITTNEEEALKTGAKPDEKSVEGIGEDALLGAVIQDALENPELLEYFLSKARDAEDALLGGKGDSEVPLAFLSPQKPPVVDSIPEVNIVEEQPEPVVDLVGLDDEKTQEVLEELEADLAAQETVNLNEEEDGEEEMEGANEGDVLDLSVLELLSPQKSVPFPDEVIADDDDEEDLDEEEEDDLGVKDEEGTDVIDIDDDSDDDDVEALEDGYTDSDDDDESVDDVTADGELPEDLDDGVF